MSGWKNYQACSVMERKIGWGDKVDDGSLDLSSRDVKVAVATVTLAQLNAGYTIVPAVNNRTYRPVGFFIKFNGTFTTATDIRLSDTNGTPVEIVTIAIAQAGDGVKHGELVGTNTLGAGFGANLTAAKGIQLRKTGSSAAGGTSVQVIVKYQITT